jgi:hypothetical protein
MLVVEVDLYMDLLQVVELEVQVVVEMEETQQPVPPRCREQLILVVEVVEPEKFLKQ